MPSPTLTRRAMLAGAGTTLASAALTAPYVSTVRSAIDADAVDAEFYAMLADWRAAYVLACDNYDDDECEKLRAIEDRMGPMRPTSAAGFAIKLLIMSSYGDFDLDSDPAQTLFEDAIAITGQPAPVLTRA